MSMTIVAQVGDEVATLWENSREFLTDQGIDFGLNLIAALTIFVFGRWAAKLVTAFVRRVCVRANVEETLIKFVGNIVYTALLVFVVTATLERLGVDTTSFAAIIAAAGLAIGLALQGSLSNFAAGVMLILFKPFRVGDFVEAGGTKGVVEEVRIFNTIMRTGDNIQITIPNSQITEATITNYSAKETRRIDLVIGCGYGDNLADVKAYLEELLAGDERVLEDPAPVVAVNELGSSSVDFVVRPWVKNEDYWTVRWDLTEQIKNDFDQRGFTIPYPTQDVHVHSASA